MTDKITPSPALAKKINDEITEKVSNYERRMSYRLHMWGQLAEMFLDRSVTKGESGISSNTAELFKSIRAISNLQYRMLTSQKPFFELEPLDMMGAADPYKMLKAEHYATNQLDISKFCKGLYRGLVQANLYGTVAINEPYKPVKRSFLGAKRFATHYEPISLVNCAFDISAYDIEDSDWVCISDVRGKSHLHSLARHDPDGKMYNTKAISDALSQEKYQPQVNEWVNQRLTCAGYTSSKFDGIELQTYYGTLDCMANGEMYVIERVNREFIVRMEIHRGIRPIRIATVNTLDIEPLGNGIGDMNRPLLRQINNVRSSLLDTIEFAGANMFAKRKSVGEEDMEYIVRKFGVMAMEDPDLRPVGPDPRTVGALAAYEGALVTQYRQSSGATDTMQAIVAGDSATATDVSLAMNEAIRNVSVSSELLADPLVTDHIKVILENGQKYQTRPFTLVINKKPIEVAPSDILIDVNVRAKPMTDQSFRPARVTKLLNSLQVMTQAGPKAIPGARLNIGPTLLELLRLQDIPNFMESVKPITEDDMIQEAMEAQLAAANMPQATTAIATAPPAPPSGTMTTPAGEVLAPPGEEMASGQAIASAAGTYDNPEAQ